MTLLRLLPRARTTRSARRGCGSAAAWRARCAAARSCSTHVCDKLGRAAAASTTADGKITLEFAECLGACEGAPAVLVNDEHAHERDAREGGRADRGIATLTLPASRIAAATVSLRGATIDGRLRTRPAAPASNKPDSHVARRLPRRRRLSRRSSKALNEMTPAAGRRRWSRTPACAAAAAPAFPCGVKWTFLPKDHPGPIYLCVNADESEPCTFNNRILMEKDPHQVLEGIMLACYAIAVAARPTSTSATSTATRYRVLQAGDRRAATPPACSARTSSASGFNLDIYLHRGAGAYICGEETGLIESLEGKRAWPRIKPPFPAVEGAFRKPTIVNNVETLACVTHIIDRGADWFKSIGVPPDPKNPRDAGSYGPKLYCISGHVNKPGCVELPLGVTVRELIDKHGGGVWKGRKAKAVHPRRHQHGLHDRGRVRHAARLQRPRQGRLPRPGHRGGHRHRRPDQHGRRAATTSASSSPTSRAASARRAARGPAGC